MKCMKRHAQNKLKLENMVATFDKTLKSKETLFLKSFAIQDFWGFFHLYNWVGKIIPYQSSLISINFQKILEQVPLKQSRAASS